MNARLDPAFGFWGRDWVDSAQGSDIENFHTVVAVVDYWWTGWGSGEWPEKWVDGWSLGSGPDSRRGEVRDEWWVRVWISWSDRRSKRPHGSRMMKCRWREGWKSRVKKYLGY